MNDMLFDFTEWLRGTWLVDLSQSISDSSLSNLMVTNFWVIPIMQTIHILAIAASFASVLMIAARVFGIAGHASLADTSRRYSLVLWWSLVVLVITGLGMITAEPMRELVNPFFWIKMVLVVIGIILAAWHAGRLRRRFAAGAPPVGAAAGSARVTAALLVILWCMIMFCGRFIAYAPV